MRDLCAIHGGKLRWPWNPGSGWVKVIESYTSEFLMCHFLLVIKCNRGRILYRSWYASSLRYTSIYCGGYWDMSVDWADRFGSFRSLVRVDHVRVSDVAVFIGFSSSWSLIGANEASCCSAVDVENYIRQCRRRRKQTIICARRNWPSLRHTVQFRCSMQCITHHWAVYYHYFPHIFVSTREGATVMFSVASFCASVCSGSFNPLKGRGVNWLHLAIQV